ncbi:MAG: hypothetical protein U1E65_07535 [Myxococcota bacterium]
MRRILLALLLLQALGCARMHNVLLAERHADYDRETAYESWCVWRTEEGLVGGQKRFELAHKDGALLVASEDGNAFWGHRRGPSGQEYAFGELCEKPGKCLDYLYFQGDLARIWAKVETTRVSTSPESFEEKIDEGELIRAAAQLITKPSQIAVFERMAEDFKAADHAKHSLVSTFIPSVITDASASASTASAVVSGQLQLIALWHYLQEHNIVLYGGKRGERREFEVLRMLCVAPKSAGLSASAP